MRAGDRPRSRYEEFRNIIGQIIDLVYTTRNSDIVKAPSESLGKDTVENWVKNGVEVVSDSRNHEEDMLSLLQRASPISKQGDHNEQKPLTVERDPTEEEGNHHNNQKIKF